MNQEYTEHSNFLMLLFCLKHWTIFDARCIIENINWQSVDNTSLLFIIFPDF